MKNVLRILGIIALVALIGFSFAACSSGDSGGGNHVYPDKPVKSIAVTKQPDKTEYFNDEVIDTTGMVVTATYEDDTEAAVTGYTIEPLAAQSTAGTQTITVKYEGKEAHFNITVTKRAIPKAATPTANPLGGELVAVGTEIALNTVTDGAEIWYTIDGSTPAKNGNGSTLYEDPFAITPPVTVKAIAVKDEFDDSDVLEAVYPATPITVADISIVLPVTGAIPSTNVTSLEQERFTSGTITWLPNDNPFKPSVAYTASVTLTAKPGYTFDGLTDANVKIGGDPASIVDTGRTSTTIIVSRTFPATGKAVSSFVIKSNPTNLTYTHGDTLSLTGLVVTLTYSDNTTEDVPAASFSTKGITTSIGHDIPLEYTTYNNVNININVGNLPTQSAGTITVYQKSLTAAEITVTGIENKTYTGNEITQSIAITHTVTSGSARSLTLDKDFTVAYSSNLNAGTATITITGIGDYTGVKTETFTINKANPVTNWPTAANIRLGKTLDDSAIPSTGQTVAGVFSWDAPTTKPPVGTNSYDATFTPNDTVNYNTVKGKVSVTVFVTSITTVEIEIAAPTKGAPQVTTLVGLDSERFSSGTISWSPNDNPFLGTTVYTATVTLTAEEGFDFQGIDNVKVNSDDATITANTGATLTLTYEFPETLAKAVSSIAIKTQPTNSLTYTHGDVLDLAGLVVTLTYDDTSNEDVNLVDFGTKGVTLTIANGHQLEYSTHNGETINIISGSATPVSVGNLTVNKRPVSDVAITVSPIASQNYTGGEIKPPVAVHHQAPVTSRNLVEGTDYTVAYSNHTAVGTAMVTITGIGDYSGTTSVTFVINAKSINDGDVEIKGGVTTKPYTGSPITQSDIEVLYGLLTLTLTTDYTVTYDGNTGAGQATITIKGVGNYTGETTVSFTISKADPVITTWPTATDIFVGQAVSDSSLTGGASTPAGSFSWVNSSTVLNVIGNNNIPVIFTPNDTDNYNTANGTVQINVKAPSVVSITVQTPPTKLLYGTTDTFDPAGLIVRATYDHGDPANIPYNNTDFTFSDSSNAPVTAGTTTFSTPGANVITVTYKTKTATFNIDASELNFAVLVGGVSQNVVAKPGINGSIFHLLNKTGYTYTYGNGYGAGIVRFQVNLGSDTLGDFKEVKFKWKGESGGAASYKNLSLLATMTEDNITPSQSDDNLNQLIVSSNTNFNNGPQVNGTSTLSVILDITKGSALTGNVWFSIYMHAEGGAYTISDIEFVLRPPPSGVPPIEVEFGVDKTVAEPGVGGSIVYVSDTGYTYDYGSQGNGNGIVRFMLDLGANTLGDYDKVTLTWTGVSGDAQDYKNLFLLASGTEADITPWKNDDDILALIVSQNAGSFYNTGPQVNGTSAHSITLNITTIDPAKLALTGNVWFSIYEHAGGGVYTITDVTFVPK